MKLQARSSALTLLCAGFFGLSSTSQPARAAEPSPEISATPSLASFKPSKKRRNLIVVNSLLITSTVLALLNQWDAASDFEALHASIDGTTELNQIRLSSEKNRVDQRADIALALSAVTLTSLAYTLLSWKDAGRPIYRPAPLTLSPVPSGAILSARVNF